VSDLQLAGLRKRFGGRMVVDGLDLAVAPGEFFSLLGPSGCGKTTLLRMVAGLAPADGGSIRVGGQDVTHMPAHRRNIGVVFQSYALFPHLTVGENIAFGMRAHRMPAGLIQARVRESLESVRLAAYADRSINALSGGEQQRVAVARALATRPSLILLDEPLSALDRKLREEMQISLRRTLREAGITAVFVTHDQDEALVMSDRIAVMNQGRIEHLGTPDKVYDQPQSLFALNFVGLSSQLRGEVQEAREGLVTVRTAVGAVRAPAGFLRGSEVVVAVRPEAVRIGPAQDGACVNHLRMPVAEIVYLGSRRLVYCCDPAAGDAVRLIAELPASSPLKPRPGEVLDLHWPVASTLAFPASAT
jgi:putative spermidine/putrescine transport system ATP-binding protein